MRVGVFLNDEGPEAGGGFTFDREVRDALGRHGAESGHDFVLFGRRPPTDGGAGAPAYVSLADGAPRRHPVSRLTRALARRAGLGPAAPARSWLYDLLEEHGVELVLGLNPFFALPEVPFATIVWDLQHRLQPFFPEVSAAGEYRRRERHYRALLPRAAIVVAGTEAGKAEIERFYQVPSERIVVAPHPTPRFALEAGPDARPGELEAVRERHRIAGAYLFYPAQLWPHKNHVGLLRALRRLRDEHDPTLSAVFAGADHGNRGHLRAEIARLDLEDAVRVLGFVSREDLIALYRGALALVYPSFFGPENLPPLEAFALGCPVVAADVPGAGEQLGDAALLVDPRRPEAIAGAVARIAAEPELRSELVARGAARARRTTGSDFVRILFRAFDDFAPVRACWGLAAGERS